MEEIEGATITHAGFGSVHDCHAIVYIRVETEAGDMAELTFPAERLMEMLKFFGVNVSSEELIGRQVLVKFADNATRLVDVALLPKGEKAATFFYNA